MNQLRSYPLSTGEIVQWSASLTRVLPGLDPEAVAYVIDAMIIGVRGYDDTKGVRNIVEALKDLRRTQSGKLCFKKEWPTT